MRFSKSLPRTEAEVVLRLQKELPRLLEGLTVERIALPPLRGRFRPDLEADIRAGPLRRRLVIEVKSLGEPRIALQAMAQLLSYVREIPNAYPVLAAPYLTESTRTLCRESGIGYLDLVGNVYLRFDRVFVDRVSPDSPQRERRAIRSLSAPKAGRVIRVLLQEPRRPQPVTALARLARVSPAEAYKVASLLELKGLTSRDSARRVVVVDPAKLLDAWAGSLDFSRNQAVYTYSPERTPEAIMRAVARAAAPPKGRTYAFTSFAGASLVAPFTRFYDVTAYIGGEPSWWLERLDLKEVESGSNLQLVTPRDPAVLDEARDVSGFRVVSDLQLYADLIGNPARGREQAVAIRKKMGF